MIKKTITIASLLAASSICLSQEVVILKSESQTLTLGKGKESLRCLVDLKFESFRYSDDRHFLIFKYIDKKYEISRYTDFINLSDAYAQCHQTSKIRVVRDPAGDNILDLNAKGNIYLTHLQDMYKTGGQTLAFRTSIAVKRLPSLKEIIFPFSIRKNDTESMARKRMGHLPHRISYDPLTITDAVQVISKNGKFIAPAGIWCEGDKPYEDVWSVDARRKISAKEIEALKRKNIRCEDLF
ncbi:hypothetical protein [Variovorax boronicumulans]|uniref:hypothetical protein n=1 Tax=Variovorax boronicumulans TaxID=436515 RepID=UPI002781ADB8|nr:hypothetical protein [Variovorax boronicumulans]MDQ0043116.1 hypothetical protein [Variovorax boronicumulans]